MSTQVGELLPGTSPPGESVSLILSLRLQDLGDLSPKATPGSHPVLFRDGSDFW